MFISGVKGRKGLMVQLLFDFLIFLFILVLFFSITMAVRSCAISIKEKEIDQINLEENCAENVQAKYFKPYELQSAYKLCLDTKGRLP